MTAYERLEAALPEGIRRGMARCPAHDDTTASLSVKNGDGKVLLHCHAGCPVDAVLEALGWSAADLYDEPPAPRRDDGVIATYTYTDEHGAALFYVERRLGKQFRQYHVAAGGDKVWNLNGVRRVPYRLPELLGAVRSGETVYVVEGEKDVHAIEAAGGVATCNPGGAGKWRAEYAGHFAGIAKVIVVADRDEPGRAHAVQVAGSLRAVADEVEVVEAATGKDASDHLAAGFGLGDFRPAAPPSIGTKKDESTNKGPEIPVAGPEIYTGILGEITMAAEPGTEADPVGILGSLLTMASVDIGPSPYVQVGNDRHPLLVWTLLFGRTGSGRKGGATQTAALFARQACPQFGSYATSGLSSGEGLIERVRDGDGGKDEGVKDKRLLCTETEFGTVMTRAARDGSTLAEVSRQAWNGDPLSVLNRRQYSASSSHIGIIGHIAPKDFRRRLAAADLAAGTYNRYLPLYVERSKRLPIPEGIDPKEVGRLAAEFGKRLDRRARHHPPPDGRRSHPAVVRRAVRRVHRSR